MFQDANYLYQLGEYERALVLFNKVLDQADEAGLKRKAQLAAEVINVLLKAERVGPQEAVKETRKAAKLKRRLDANRLSGLYKEAFRYLYNEEYDKSIAVFKEILVLNPQEEKAKLYLDKRIPELLQGSEVKVITAAAKAAFERGDYESAMAEFKKAVAIDQYNTEAKIYIDEKIPQALRVKKARDISASAREKFDRGEFDAAKEGFKEALSLDPSQAEAKEYLGTKLPSVLRTQEINVLYEEGKAAFDKGDYETAIDKFSAILALDKSQVQAKQYLERRIPSEFIKTLYEKGREAYDRADYEEALRKFYRVLAIDPDEKEAKEFVEKRIPYILNSAKIKELYKQGRTEFKDARYDDAAGKFKQIVDIDPSESEARDYLEVKIPEAVRSVRISFLYKDAFLCLGVADYKQAEERFKEVLNIDPQESKAKEYLDSVIPRLYKEKEASKIVKEAKDAFAAGRFQEAINKCNMALTLVPQQAEAREYVENKIPAMVREIKIKSLYKEGATAFDGAKYDLAERSFSAILELDASEKEAAEYLKNRIPEKLRQLKIASLRKEAKDAFAAGRLDDAEKKFKEILSISSSDQEAGEYVRKVIPAAVAESKIRKMYEEANAAFKSGRYEESFLKFKQILALDPSQQQARDYAENKIPPILLDLQIKALLKEAVVAFNTADYALSIDKFNEVLKIDPANSQASEYLQKTIPEALSKAKIKALLQEAVNYFQASRFDEAVGKFQNVLSLQPGQPSAVEYLEKKIPQAVSAVKISALYKEAQAAQVKGDSLTAGKKRVLAYLYEMAFSNCQKGELRTAKEYFRRIVSSSRDEKLAQAYLKEAE